ncbi:MAG: hypothetical protein ABL982_00085 [Vicinamibacterales bacterium]
MADDALKGIIDKAVAAGLSDDDVRGIVAEHRRRAAATPAAASATPAPTSFMDTAGAVVGDTLRGAKAGLVRTAVHGGDYIRRGLGMDRIIDEPDVQAAMTPPASTAGKVGFGVEQAAEFLAPGALADRAAIAVSARVAPRVGRVAARVLSRSAAGAGSSAVVAKSQGRDASSAAVWGGAFPVAGEAVTAGGRFLKSTAPAWVRSELKPTVASMKSQPGADWIGINKVADDITQFILTNRVTSPAKAQAIINRAEDEVQRIVQEATAKGVTVPAPQLALRRLQALRASAAKAGGQWDSVDIIDNAIADFMKRSPLTESVTRAVVRPASMTERMSGRAQPQVATTASRELRTDVSPQEALSGARLDARFRNRDQFGSTKGASTEVSKEIERGQRNAVKAVLPEVRPVLREEGKAIAARNMLERSQFRVNNTDPINPMDATTMAVEVGAGQVPVISTARAFLRNNKLRLGIWSDRLANAIASNNAQAAGAILRRFGAAAGGSAAAESAPGQAPTRPAAAAQTARVPVEDALPPGAGAAALAQANPSDFYRRQANTRAGRVVAPAPSGPLSTRPATMRAATMRERVTDKVADVRDAFTRGIGSHPVVRAAQAVTGADIPDPNAVPPTLRGEALPVPGPAALLKRAGKTLTPAAAKLAAKKAATAEADRAFVSALPKTASPSAVVAATKTHGGYTVHPGTGELVAPGTKGAVMVGRFPNSNPRTMEVSLETFGPADVRKFYAKNRDVFAKDPDAHLGAWVDTESGKAYLDVSSRKPDVRAATKFGELQKQVGVQRDAATGELPKAQKAVWDATSGNELPVGNLHEFVKSPEFQQRLDEMSRAGNKAMGGDFKNWWDITKGPLARVYGKDRIDEVAGMLASTSPRNGPVSNMQMASELLRRVIKGEPVKQPNWRAPATAMGDQTAVGGFSPKPGAKFPNEGTYGGNAERVATGQGARITSDKVNDMRRALLGDEDVAVIDRHYAKVAEDPARGIFTDVKANRVTGSMQTGKREAYPDIENAVRTASKRAGVPLANYSAWVWEGIRDTIRQTGKLFGQSHRASAIPETTTGFNEIFEELVSKKAKHLGVTVQELERRLKSGDAELLGVLLSSGAGATAYQQFVEAQRRATPRVPGPGQRAVPPGRIPAPRRTAASPS